MHRYTSGWRYVRFIMTFTAGLWMFALSAAAQTHSGNIFGTVVDKSGAVLPGVTVTVSGVGAPQTFVTDRNGQFRFLQLSPGTYNVRAELEGFGKTQRQVDVTVGNNTEIEMRLDPSVTESITVTAASPVIDRLEVSTGANIEQIELQKVPTARDPWVVLQSVPSVLVDRVNVGGNKSGQQSYFVAKGVERNQAVWNINGVQTEDMSGSRGSAGVGFYVDFESFQEFGIVTGSTDPSVRTPGVQINLVTKRGTNDLKGSTRYFYTGKSLQADPTLPAETKLYGLTSTNSINRITEFGAEGGGPIIRDRIFLWGAYSQNPINISPSTFVPAGSPNSQKTKLTNWNGRLNAQILPSNAANLSYTYNLKTVAGRGLSATRAWETAHNQGGPGWVWSLEDTQNFSNSFYLTGRGSAIHNGYYLEPIGGRDIPVEYVFNASSQRVPTKTYYYFEQTLNQRSAALEGSKFFNFSRAANELKFGFDYRSTPVTSVSGWPGGGIILRHDWKEVVFTREARPNFGSKYKDFYIGDTLTLGNAVVTGGFRYDDQSAKNNATSTGANPLYPDLVPGGTYPGDAKAMTWKSISPRLGVTYALGRDRKSLIKASYNKYVDQLGAGAVGPQNPFYRIAYLWYFWDDVNGDRKFTRDELRGFDTATNFNPANRTAGQTSTARIDYDMDPTTTNEFIIGFDREIGPSFAVSANYTQRKRENILWEVFEKTRGSGDYLTPADWVQVTGANANIIGTLPNGQAYSIPNYRLSSTLPCIVSTPRTCPTYTVVTNRPDYEVSYKGLELVGTKRMQNHWMMRGNVTFSDWKQNIKSARAITNGDPTPVLSGSSCATCLGENTYASNGGADGFINSRWSAALNTVVELPWAFTVSAAMVGREGYIIPYRRQINNGDRIGTKNILVSPSFDDTRLDNMYQVDLGFRKEFKFARDLGVSFSADLFNATNSRTVLWREYTLATPTGTDQARNNQIREMQNPRVWRFGARVTF